MSDEIWVTFGSKSFHLGYTHRRRNNNNFHLILIKTAVNYRLAILLMFINGLAPYRPLNIERSELIGPDRVNKTSDYVINYGFTSKYLEKVGIYDRENKMQRVVFVQVGVHFSTESWYLVKSR